MLCTSLRGRAGRCGGGSRPSARSAAPVLVILLALLFVALQAAAVAHSTAQQEEPLPMAVVLVATPLTVPNMLAQTGPPTKVAVVRRDTQSQTAVLLAAMAAQVS